MFCVIIFLSIFICYYFNSVVNTTRDIITPIKVKLILELLGNGHYVLSLQGHKIFYMSLISTQMQQ